MQNVVIKNKLTRKGTLRQVFYLSEAQNPIPLPPYALYTCIQYRAYTHGRGGRGGRVNQREGNRGEGYTSQSWVENTNTSERTQEIGYLLSVNYEKHLPQSPFTGYMTTFCIDSMDTYFIKKYE
jgi:hypothetical protein